MAGRREEYKGDEIGTHGVRSLRIHGGRVSPFQSEDLVEVKVSLVADYFAFLIFILNPNICFWVFIICATTDGVHPKVICA